MSLQNNEEEIRNDRISRLISNTSKYKFKILAGIIKNDTLAILSIPKTKETIQLKHIPNWIDRLKYKVCGFNIQIVRNNSNDKKHGNYYFTDNFINLL